MRLLSLLCLFALTAGAHTSAPTSVISATNSASSNAPAPDGDQEQNPSPQSGEIVKRRSLDDDELLKTLSNLAAPNYKYGCTSCERQGLVYRVACVPSGSRVLAKISTRVELDRCYPTET